MGKSKKRKRTEGNGQVGSEYQGERKTFLIVCGVLVVCILAIYSQTSTFSHITYDDPQYVFANRHIQDGVTTQSLKWAFTQGHASNWHPLTWVSHMIDIGLFGLDSGKMHIVNMLFHIANSLLLFVLFRYATGSIYRSAFVAAVFAVHPQHVESVAWISERKDMLSTFFWMLTSISYVYYTRKPGVRRYLLVILLFALGLMSKPMLVSLPLILLVMDYWPLKRLAGEHGIGLSKLILEKVPLVILATGSSVATYLVQQQGGATTTLVVPFVTRLSNAAVSLVNYIANMLWPVRLALFYPHPVDATPAIYVALSVVFLAVVTVLAVKYASRARFVLAGWLWYLISMLPVIGIVQVGKQAMADRYTYVTMIGLYVIIAWGVPALIERFADKRTVGDIKKISGYAAVVLIAILLFLSHKQTGYWESPLNLYRRNLEVTKNNALIHNNLGSVLYNMGNKEEAHRHFEKAIDIDPDFADALFNYALGLGAQGDFREAEKYLRRAIENRPDHAPALNWLGIARDAQGDLKSAVKYWKTAFETKPEYLEPAYNLSAAYEVLSEEKKAVKVYERVLEIYPEEDKARYKLAVLLSGMGKEKDAIKHFEIVVKDRPDYALAHYNLGVAYHKTGDLADAERSYLEAIELDPSIAEAFCNLGVIMERKGDLQKAIEYYEEALYIKPDYKTAQSNLMSVKSRLGTR